MNAKKIPSRRAIILPELLLLSVPEHIKKITPAKMTQTGQNAFLLNFLVIIRLARNSQIVAVYCIPIAIAADVFASASIMLMQSAQ